MGTAEPRDAEGEARTRAERIVAALTGRIERGHVRPDGPDLEDLAARIAATSAKVFFTQSLAHNPTGCSLALPVAHRLLGLAAAHDLVVVESDPFADVLPATSVRLAAQTSSTG